MRTHRCRFACFTIAQWEKEAAWLRQQHQKGWQFTHLTAGVFYHFAACPPEDVVYHLEYQDQKDLEAEPLQSLRRRGWAYADRFTQYFYFRKPAKDISPEEAALLQNPAAQLGMVRRVFWGRMFPLFPVVGGVFLPQFLLTPPVDRTVALLFALVLVAYGAVFLQFARQYLRLRREV